MLKFVCRLWDGREKNWSFVIIDLVLTRHEFGYATSCLSDHPGTIAGVSIILQECCNEIHRVIIPITLDPIFIIHGHFVVCLLRL